MDEMASGNETSRQEAPDQDRPSALPVDASRAAMMRRVKRMPLEQRIALLDRMCREGTRIATRARRIK